jgi:nucleoside-diphosphate-sugar epimerase
VYGSGRQRSIIYVADVASAVTRLASMPFTGFNCFNLSGKQVTIETLARKVVSLVGRGAVCASDLPADVKAIDVGNAVMSEKRLVDFLGSIPSNDLDTSLRVTIDYFKGLTL